MFKYFEDPENYAYLEESHIKCCVCGTPDPILYSIVTDEFDCSCARCLLDGRLIESKTWINDCDPDHDDSDIITYQTPPLPTWQDLDWPSIDGSFCTFIKLASKVDFGQDFEVFRDSAFPNQVDHAQIQELWYVLPSNPITSLETGNYDTSFYLFRHSGRIYWMWDAN